MLTEKVNKEQILMFLKSIDSSFYPPLSSRLNLMEYSAKLYKKGKVLALLENNLIGSAVFYYIDNAKAKAYIPVLGSIDSFQGKGNMLFLMKTLEAKLKKEKFESLSMETWEGSRALNFYIKQGYTVESFSNDRPNSVKSVHLIKWLSKTISNYPFTELELEFNEKLNKQLGIKLFIKRDDLFPVIGGGSKARKLKYILKSAVDRGCTAIVTAGSNHSNHLRAAAVMCRELGLKFTACIHDKRPSIAETRGNLKLTLDLADNVHFVEMKEIKDSMDKTINDYIAKGEKPFYIWGGGHCIEGSYSFYEAAKDTMKSFKEKDKPDYIFVASGTGTTQAGITLGVKEISPDAKIIGVSIARHKERGEKAIVESLSELKTFLQKEELNYENPIVFDDGYLFGGYAKVNEEYLSALKKIRKEFGLVLDPIYSGKAFYALLDYIERGLIPRDAKVLFWNTGGVLNIT